MFALPLARELEVNQVESFLVLLFGLLFCLAVASFFVLFSSSKDQWHLAGVLLLVAPFAPDVESNYQT